MILSNTKRGQYFSMDAIVASVIFVLALSLLMSHFFSLRAMNDSRSSYLVDDAYRISDLLLGPGDPPNWYVNPNGANTSGFGYNNSRDGTLNLTALNAAAVLLDDPGLKNYNQTRSLIVTPAEFFVLINTTSIDPLVSNLSLIRLGYEPLPRLNPQEIVTVRRGVTIVDYSGFSPHYHYGTMTLTLWMNRTRV